jgi:hypothetical protein
MDDVPDGQLDELKLPDARRLVAARHGRARCGRSSQSAAKLRPSASAATAELPGQLPAPSPDALRGDGGA